MKVKPKGYIRYYPIKRGNQAMFREKTCPP